MRYANIYGYYRITDGHDTIDFAITSDVDEATVISVVEKAKEEFRDVENCDFFTDILKRTFAENNIGYEQHFPCKIEW